MRILSRSREEGRVPRLEAYRQLNAFFDQTYVLTIERNEDRRALLEPVLEGLDFEYVFGVDGSRVPEAELHSDYDDARGREIYGRSLSNGQVGCALSHRMAYEDMVHNGHRNALILEDDAFFPDDRAGYVEPVLDQLPADWDLLYLYTDRKGETPLLDAKVKWVYPLLNRTGLRSYDLEAIRRIHSRPYSRNLREAGKHWMALAYAITREMAHSLIDYQSPVVTPSDDALRTFCASPETRAFLSTPNVFVPRGLDSTIWNRPARKGVKRW